MEKEFVNVDDVTLIEGLLDAMVYIFVADVSMK
jgi:hypothetical protein